MRRQFLVWSFYAEPQREGLGFPLVELKFRENCFSKLWETLSGKIGENPKHLGIVAFRVRGINKNYGGCILPRSFRCIVR